MNLWKFYKYVIAGLSIRASTWYFIYPPKMVFCTSWFKRVLYKIFMKIVPILIKKVLPVNNGSIGRLEKY